MQIVIDIPDKDYQVTLTKIMLACYGCKITELPKRHGALKDADEVMKVMERNCDMQELYLPIHFKQFALDEAQTIIEADKEVDE